MLLFSDVAQTLSKIEEKAGRLEMTDILAELFKKTSVAEVDRLVYIIQGILAPPYEGIDLGLGEKFAVAAIASAAGYSKEEVHNHYKKTGDLGLTAQELLGKKKQLALSEREMDVTYVHNALLKIAKTGGTGSQELKIKYLTEMLNNATPLEARYIIRFVLGRLRLGVGDPTILDALSVCKFGDKSFREQLERAFNVCADLGHVAKTFFKNKKEIEKFHVTPFKPLMPALAERLSTPEEIFEKLGKCAIEYKLDGFRMQVHKKGSEVAIYSRNLENITFMFPEVTDSIKKLKAKEIIFEGEALAYNEKQKRFYSFQETMHRRRKYGIGQAQKELPLYVFCFDVLYLDGKDLTMKPYKERRKKLERVFPSGVLRLGEMELAKDVETVESMFTKSIASGLEGIMAKDLGAAYAAGKRKFAWIKLKKSYGRAVDTVDAVIVGYFLGRGSRAEFEFGGLLVAVYNEDRNRLETIAKIGSGYSEQEMASLQKMLDEIKTETPSPKLDFREPMVPDFWVTPKHTCGMKEEKGYALRFPRMLMMRGDKGVNDITTTREVISLYEKQRK
jgi:DNA ligase-1